MAKNNSYEAKALRHAEECLQLLNQALAGVMEAMVVAGINEDDTTTQELQKNIYNAYEKAGQYSREMLIVYKKRLGFYMSTPTAQWWDDGNDGNGGKENTTEPIKAPQTPIETPKTASVGEPKEQDNKTQKETIKTYSYGRKNLSFI